jgi:hypothetical protein
MRTFGRGKLRSLAVTYVKIDATVANGVAGRPRRSLRERGLKTGFRKFDAIGDIPAGVVLANRIFGVDGTTQSMEADA